MNSLVSRPPHGIGCRPTPGRKRASKVAANAFNGQLTNTLSSVQEPKHFGTKAIEEFEKSKLGDIDVSSLTNLTQELKSKVKNLEISAGSPIDLGAALDSIKTSTAARLAIDVPIDGQFQPHWGTQVVTDILNALSESTNDILHQLLSEIVSKSGNIGL